MLDSKGKFGIEDLNRFFTYLFFGLLVFRLQAQESSNALNERIANYLYDFAKNIGWPNENKTSYRFHALSNNANLNAELVEMAKQRRINNRPIQISTGRTIAEIPSNIDLIFVLGVYNELVPLLYERLEGRPILMVTDHFGQDQFTMINFINNQDKLDFEMNPGNIERQRLKILSGMSILGGSIISDERLYRAELARAREMEEEIKAYNQDVDSLQRRLSGLSKLINTQKTQLSLRNKDVDNFKSLLKKKEQELYRLEQEITTKQKELEKETNDLQFLRTRIRDQQTQAERQKTDLQQQKIILDQLNESIEDKETEIQMADQKMQEYDSTLSLQRNVVLSLMLVVGLVVALAVLLFVGYRDKQKANQHLKQQKSELSELLDELHKTQSQLVQSEKMASLGTLTAGIAHEINNAINFVYNGVHILNQNFGDVAKVIDRLNNINPNDKHLKSKLEELETVKKENFFEEAYAAIPAMINNVKIGAERTTGIVKGLRTFSRTNQEEKSMVNLHKDLDLALLLLKSKYKDNITIIKDYDDRIPKIAGYEGELNQAFVNLINNAIDAINETEKDGTIILKTQLFTNKEILISIKDTGIGISDENAEKIFDPFFTTKKIGVGTGLGLSITYGIIEKHSGTITVDSEKDMGTEFRISLPLSTETA